MFVSILRRPRASGRGRHTVAAMSRLVLVLLLAAGLCVAGCGRRGGAALADAGAAGHGRRRVQLRPGGALCGWAPSWHRPAWCAGDAGGRGVCRCRDLRGSRAGVGTWREPALRWAGGDRAGAGLGLGRARRARRGRARRWAGSRARGLLRLGARRAGVRQGYVDPLGLLGPGERFAPPVVAPRGGPAVRPGPRPHAAPSPALVPHGRPATAVVPAAIAHPTAVVAPRAAALSWPAWSGLALLVVGAGGGGAARRHGPRRRRTGMALAQR